jgi:hypothetical protein
VADINIERKKSPLPWIIGAIVLLLIIWGLFQFFDNDDVDLVEPLPAATTPADPIEPVVIDPAPTVAVVTPAPMPPPPTDADNTPIPVPVIVVGPAPFIGQPVVGTAQVAEVPSDRGFWLEKDGQRMFAMIAKSPNMEDAINVNPGQTVRLAGVIYDKSMASQIAGGIDADAMQILADQPVFLLVNANNVMVVER